MIEQVFVVIENSLVVNGIVADENFAASIRPNYEAVLDVTEMDPHPGIGWGYEKGHLYAPQPFPSWTLDANYEWQPPTPMPDDGGVYAWDEETLMWVRENV